MDSSYVLRPRYLRLSNTAFQHNHLFQRKHAKLGKFTGFAYDDGDDDGEIMGMSMLIDRYNASFMS